MARGFATLQLDDLVNTFIDTSGISPPTTKALQVSAIANRRRATRIKRDTTPLEFEVRGTWLDGGGKLWRDFKAQLMGFDQVPFNLGDGSEYRMVDVLDVAGTRKGGIFDSSGAGAHQEAWAYSAKLVTYEPYSRQIGPALSSAVALQPGRPAAPTVAVVGTAGTTSYSYALVAQYATGDSVQSPATTITTGNATLSSSNYNQVTLPALPGGATGWRVLRTAGGASQGQLASGLAAGTYNDQGGTASAYTATGQWTTNLSVSYPGTAPGEPTWQVTLVVPSGVTVTGVSLQNTVTGETITVTGLTVTNGTYYLLLDACGGSGSGSPNNNGYGLLAINSNGYGATLSGTGDVDFTGVVPTLAQAQGVPPVATSNTMVVTLTANGQLTSAQLQWLAPARYVR